MTWFKVDDGFGEHPKVDALGKDTAIALTVWLLCGNACARNLTDGIVTPTVLARACAALSPTMRERGVGALVRVGLWTDRDDGWAFHDWHEHQPSRDEVLAKREEEKLKKRAKRNQLSQGDTPGDSPAKSVGTPQGTPEGSLALPSRPVPTRPDSPSLREGVAPPHLGWLRVLYAEWKAMAGGVPGTGTVERLADAWDSPWKLTRFERETLERAQAVHGVVGTENALRGALGAFAADSFATAKKYPFGLFAKQIAAYASKGAHPASVSDFSHVPDNQEPF